MKLSKAQVLIYLGVPALKKFFSREGDDTCFISNLDAGLLLPGTSLVGTPATTSAAVARLLPGSVLDLAVASRGVGLSGADAS